MIFMRHPPSLGSSGVVYRSRNGVDFRGREITGGIELLERWVALSCIAVGPGNVVLIASDAIDRSNLACSFALFVRHSFNPKLDGKGGRGVSSIHIATYAWSSEGISPRLSMRMQREPTKVMLFGAPYNQ